MANELPNQWRRYRVSDLAEVFDGPHATPRTVEAGPIFLGIQALQNGRLVLDQTRHVTEADFKKWTRRVEPRPGDLAFSYETRLGEAALIPEGLRCCLGRRMGLLRLLPDAPVLPEMLLFAYLGPQFQSALRLNTIHGSTVERLPIKRFGEFPIVLPPLSEQRAIVYVLETLDDKIASNRRTATSADEAWMEATARVFVGAGVTPISELIRSGRLVINDGYRAKNSELAATGVPFVRAGNLVVTGLALDGADLVPPEVVDRAGIKTARPWDTAFTSKGTVGRITLVPADPEPFVYSPQVCFWRSLDHERLSPLVLHAWMRSARFTAQIDAVKGQTDMADYVSLRDQRAMVMDLPSEADQRHAHSFAEPLARLAAGLRRETRTLESLRDALLPKLVSGQIRVPLSDDPEEMVGAAAEAVGVT